MSKLNQNTIKSLADGKIPTNKQECKNLSECLNEFAKENSKKDTRKIDDLSDYEIIGKKGGMFSNSVHGYFEKEYRDYNPSKLIDRESVEQVKTREFLPSIKNQFRGSSFSFPTKDRNVYYYGKEKKAFVIIPDREHTNSKHARIIVTGYDENGIRFSIGDNDINKQNSSGNQKVFKNRHEYLITKDGTMKKIEYDNPNAENSDEDAIVKNNENTSIHEILRDPSIELDYSKMLIIPGKYGNTGIYLMTKRGITVNNIQKSSNGKYINPTNILLKIIKQYQDTVLNSGTRLIDTKSGNILLHTTYHRKYDENSIPSKEVDVEFSVRFFDRGYTNENGASTTTFVPIIIDKQYVDFTFPNPNENLYTLLKNNEIFRQIYDMPGLLECTLLLVNNDIKNNKNIKDVYKDKIENMYYDIYHIFGLLTCREKKISYENKLGRLRTMISNLNSLSERPELKEYSNHLSLITNMLYFCCGKMLEGGKDIEECRRYDDKEAWKIINNHLELIKHTQEKQMQLPSEEEKEESTGDYSSDKKDVSPKQKISEIIQENVSNQRIVTTEEISMFNNALGKMKQYLSNNKFCKDIEDKIQEGESSLNKIQRIDNNINADEFDKQYRYLYQIVSTISKIAPYYHIPHPKHFYKLLKIEPQKAYGKLMDISENIYYNIGEMHREKVGFMKILYNALVAPYPNDTVKERLCKNVMTLASDSKIQNGIFTSGELCNNSRDITIQILKDICVIQKYPRSVTFHKEGFSNDNPNVTQVTCTIEDIKNFKISCNMVNIFSGKETSNDCVRMCDYYLKQKEKSPMNAIDILKMLERPEDKEVKKDISQKKSNEVNQIQTPQVITKK